MSVTITVCTTCKLPADRVTDPAGRPSGAVLADALQDGAQELSAPVAIVRHECLWACAQACTIIIGEHGKTGYLAGRLAPTAEATAAVLAWAVAYGDSETGEVPYSRWSEGIKGHFIARIPSAAGGGK